MTDKQTAKLRLAALKYAFAMYQSQGADTVLQNAEKIFQFLKNQSS